MLMSILKGAAAGAAGTTALNATTYLDMTVRARPTSSTPEDTVERLAEVTHVDIPGEGDDRDNRVAGLGPLSGIVTGVGVGALLGLTRALDWRPPVAFGAVTATLLALVGANGPMAALGISDPRTCLHRTGPPMSYRTWRTAWSRLPPCTASTPNRRFGSKPPEGWIGISRSAQ